MGHQIWRDWKDRDWEFKARANPLFAVQSTDDLAESSASNFSPEALDSLFARGRKLFRKNIAPLLEGYADPLLAEYGCGVGRILKAATEAGHRCIGIDISPTMLAHCRELAPRVQALHAVDEDGRSTAPDSCAEVVFSYAVLQHIPTLSAYLAALDEMCRILAPGGVLALHLNCEDFAGGDLAAPGRTENFETYSLHYRPGEAKPYLKHDQDNWSGVYMGCDRLVEHLAGHGLAVKQWRYHQPLKPRGLWALARKA
jgi:SAM-dependent methyltransferase